MPRWKAREFEFFGTLYAIPILVDILPRRQILNWFLYVQAVYLLNQTVVTTDQVNTSKALIVEFLKDARDIYGDAAMSFNMHLSSHFSMHVEGWGPFWDLSGYYFESANGVLKEVIHSQQGIPNQIIRALSWRNALKVLEPSASQKARDYVASITQKKNKCKRTLPVESALLLGAPIVFKASDEEEFLCNSVQIDVRDCEGYKKLVLNRCVYEVKRKPKNNKKNATDNSVARLADGRFILIRRILYDRRADRCIILGSEINCDPFHVPIIQGITVERNDICLWRVRSIDEEMCLIRLNQLKKVCCRCVFPHGDFVSPLPNVMTLS